MENKDMEKVKQVVEEQKQRQWTVAFNELCSDGVFRPFLVRPKNVTNVKRLDSPHKFGDYKGVQF